MGPELGAKMMKLVPPVGWGDIATKPDLSALETKLDGMANRLDTKIDGLAAGLRGEMAQLRGEMAGLQGRMDGLSGQVVKTILPWFLGSQAALLAMMGVLVR